MINWHLGTMGFGYKEWVGPFYPAGMPARNYLSHYSGLFDAVEIDATFYGPPRPEQVERWTAVTPPHFTFCAKTPKAITHEAPLADGIDAMHAFLSTMNLLGDKLGVILIQFPPSFAYDQFNNLMAFLKELPPENRFAVEFRHRSWDTPGTETLLAQHHISWVTADYIHLAREVKRTTDFLYLRFIGPHGQFATKDRELVDKTAALQQWQARLQPHLDKVSDVYGFFNNDYSGFSPATCNRFKQIIGLEAKEIRPYQQRRLL
jgi:uncharacterized protein YecE (DUF72 family)